MLWLVLIGGVPILGLGFTQAGLAYDEWQQRHVSRKTSAALEDRQPDMEFKLWRTAATT
jgi:hypothetical protein